MSDTMKHKPLYADKLLVVRPLLAVALIERGCKFKAIPHPWRQGWTAWLFPVTLTVREVAAPFYAEMGKPVPRCLREEAPADE